MHSVIAKLEVEYACGVFAALIADILHVQPYRGSTKRFEFSEPFETQLKDAQDLIVTAPRRKLFPNKHIPSRSI